MGRLSKALYESFNIAEGLQDEVLDSLEDTGSISEEKVDEIKNDSVNESLVSESLWDKIAPALGLDREGNMEPGLHESLHINESNENLSQILDQYYELLIKQDLGPKEAKRRLLGEVGMQESLQEEKQPELSRTERRAKRKKDFMESICREFREAADFDLNEELTEDKLKYEDWRIKNLALKNGIPSGDIREALLKGSK